MILRIQAQRGRAAYLLVECLIHIALLAVVMEVAFSAFYGSLTGSRDLARNANDILGTLRAGEVWRADVRQATAAPEIVTAEGLVAFEIPHDRQAVVYLFGKDVVWRKDGLREPKALLRGVKGSQFVKDERKRITSWRWELELASKKKVVRVHPLFTFQAVAGQAQP